MTTKEFRARIWVKLTDDLLPAPRLSKAELEARLREHLDVGAADSAVESLAVEDPNDTRTRRR